MESNRNQKEHCVLIKLIVVPYHWSTAEHNKTMIVIIIIVVLIHTTNFLECLSNAFVLGARYNFLMKYSWFTMLC